MERRPLPAWFDDAKFGIFVHWTAAAVPAFAPVGPSPFDLAADEGPQAAFAKSPYVEWYQNSLAIEGSPVQLHHRERYGDLPYDAFVAEFLAGHVHWDPAAWASLFADAGARYVVLVTKHHDGVVLWPTEHPNPHKDGWQSPRDIVGDLAGAVRARGMRFGTYYSGGLDWTFGGLPIEDWGSLFRAIPQSEEYLAYANAHWLELVDRYEPCVMWNDIGYPSAADLDGLFARYFERVPDGVVNNRFDFVRQTSGEVHADFVTPEYSIEATPGRKWESTRGLGTSFGFNREEDDSSYLSSDELVHMLVEVVAHGGNLLLNVGPAGDGTIPFVQAQRLLGLGWWLRTNGSAVFDTRPWRTTDGRTAGGNDVRFTATRDGGSVHAIVLGPVNGRAIEILDVRPADDARVEVLGLTGPMDWTTTERGMRVDLPSAPPPSPATVVRISPLD